MPAKAISCSRFLTPAYDLLSTKLVLPEDKEELALTLCGKKRKITAENFISAMLQSSISEKVCGNIFNRFVKTKDKWIETIHKSFLPKEMQQQYTDLITQNINSLQNI